MKTADAVTSFALILIITFTIVSTLPFCAASSEPLVEWQKTYGGTSGDAIVQASDGGYVIAATFVGEQRLIKTDVAGNIVWNVSIGYSSISNIVEFVASDDGYIVAQRSGESPIAVLLVKINGDGVVQWSIPYQVSAFSSYLNYATQTNDGGYVFVGGTKTPNSTIDETWILKTGSDGNKQWNITYRNFTASLITQTLDGNYVFAGDSGGQDASFFITYIAKMDGTGNILWQKSFENQTGYRPRSLISTSDGGFMLAGARYLPSGSAAAFALKTDSQGNLQWTRTFGENSGFRVAIENSDNNSYIFAGGTYNIQQDYFARLVHTNAMGDVEWQTSYSGIGNGYVYSLVQTRDGGYAFTGATSELNSTSTEMWLVKVGSNGTSNSWLYIAGAIIIVAVVAAFILLIVGGRKKGRLKPVEMAVSQNI
jgi:hypothetical protein